MRSPKQIIFTIIILALISFNCNSNKSTDNNRVIVGISSDIESLNPLYAFSITESYITDQLFIPLVHHTWNNNLGEIESGPMLAESWKWNSDSTSIDIKLRKDVFWSDGIPVTSEDVVYSYDIYSDPVVESRFLGTFKNFYTEKDGHIIIDKTFRVISPDELTISFTKDYPATLFAIDLPILPKHIFNKLDRTKIKNDEVNFNPVTDGAFLFEKWDKEQSIRLKADSKSFLSNKDGISSLIFKIIPDYNSRLMQLQNGEIDIMTDIRPDDVSKISNSKNLQEVSIKGSEYDYFGWNNIDRDVFLKTRKIVPNKLFGSAKVRQALTYALNRNEIIENYLENRGEIALGPIAPIFKSIFDTSIIPYEFNPDKAKALLAEEGWLPSPKDGILVKNGLRFSFKISMAAGNPRREFAAEIFKNNLKAIGVEAEIEKLEPGSFFQKLFNREFNAWLGGWAVPIPIDLKSYWHSDLEEASFNLTGYGNPQVDALLKTLDKRLSYDQRVKTYREIQKILHNDQPVSFLYWVDKIVGYNKRIGNINITPLGALYDCNNWVIKK